MWVLRIYVRDKSNQDTRNVITNHQDGTQSIDETYTELGNTMAEESENHYDSIARQEKYINANVV